jgi:hypothetical protein
MSTRLVEAIELPDGTRLRGRGLSQPLPSGPMPTFGLYLGRPPDETDAPHPPGFRLPRRRPAWRPDWRAEWVDWPDFRTPRDGVAAAAAIRRAYLLARDGERVEVACTGGTGRTGTVIACMAILAGHPLDDAVSWARRHYRPRAVETPGQRRWITWFAEHG